MTSQMIRASFGSGPNKTLMPNRTSKGPSTTFLAHYLVHDKQ